MGAEENKTVDQTLIGTPTKPGYTFAGWKIAADGSGPDYNFSIPLTEDVDVYAAWEPEETSYYASIWLQNAEDVNVYEYSEAVELRGLSGTETTIPEDLEERYPGFEVVVDTSEVKTISGIGDTHINVYLKRKTYNINIYVENPKNSRQYYYAFYSSLRYGQDTSYVYDYLKTYNNGIYRNYLWFDGPTSGTYFTHPPKMPSNDINIYGRDQGANSYQYTLYFKEYDPDKSMLAMNDVSDPFVFKIRISGVD